MSTEKNPLLVLGWLEGTAEELTNKLHPIAIKFNVEHEDYDLPTILTEDYSHLFTQHLTKDLSLFCQDNEIEIVSGSNGSENGDWYFGFGIPYLNGSEVSKLTTLLNDLNKALEKTIEQLDIKKPETYNVINWF